MLFGQWVIDRPPGLEEASRTATAKRFVNHARHMELGLGPVRAYIAASLRRPAAGRSCQQTDDQASGGGLESYFPALRAAVLHGGPY